MAFVVQSVAEVAERADVLALLIPDEVQREVYNDILSTRLRGGQTLDFAHGYNIHFGLIAPPPDVDVIMVAPRMIGTEVRESFVAGRGAPAFIAVAQDASGHALETALAWARGIGATRAGAFKTTFAEETELDLFQEQAVWPLLFRTWTMAFEFLVEKGFPPEMVALEMYGSGEAAEIFREMARVGFFKQTRFHSQTSQYGTLSRASAFPLPRISATSWIKPSPQFATAGSTPNGAASRPRATRFSINYARKPTRIPSTRRRKRCAVCCGSSRNDQGDLEEVQCH